MSIVHRRNKDDIIRNHTTNLCKYYCFNGKIFAKFKYKIVFSLFYKHQTSLSDSNICKTAGNVYGTYMIAIYKEKFRIMHDHST